MYSHGTQRADIYVLMCLHCHHHVMLQLKRCLAWVENNAHFRLAGLTSIVFISNFVVIIIPRITVYYYHFFQSC